MTALSDVRDDTRFRVHGSLETFSVSRRNDSVEAQTDFGRLTNELSRSPVAGYDHELDVDKHTGRPYEIRFRRQRP
jgi:hypothetical protein